MLRPPRIPERLFLPSILVLGAVLFFYRLGEKDLWEKAESVAALGARDMAENGHWAFPYFHDRPFVDNRPPGIYWAIAASYAVTDRRDEWAARLPAAIAGLLTVLLVYRIGKRIEGPATGFLAALTLLGAFKFGWQGRVSESDEVLALFTLMAYWCFWRSLKGNGGGIVHVLLFQLCLGLAGMMKGPAIAFVLFFPIGSWLVLLVLGGRWRDVPWIAIMATAPLSAAIAGGWYAYVAFYTPERDQLVLRFTSQSELHVRPFYYYAEKLPAILGLAIFLVPPLAAGLWKAGRAALREPLGYFAILALAQLAAFHLIASKQTHYPVPMLPALAIAIGIVIARNRIDEGPYFRILALVTATLLPLIVASWALFAPEGYRPESPVRAWIAFAILAAVTIWTWTCDRAGLRSAAWRASWIGCILGLAVVLGEFVPLIDARKGPRPFAERVASVVPRGATIGSLAPCQSLQFYLDRPIVLVAPEGAREFLARPDRYLFVDSRDDVDLTGLEPLVTWPSFRQSKVTAYLYEGGR
jgi:4-amino-4-deoxy-L-arabinose transferase-like glycosyltransferase